MMYDDDLHVMIFFLTPPELKKKSPDADCRLQTAHSTLNTHTNAFSSLFFLLSCRTSSDLQHTHFNIRLDHLQIIIHQPFFFFLLVATVPSPISLLFIRPSANFSSLLPLIYRIISCSCIVHTIFPIIFQWKLLQHLQPTASSCISDRSTSPLVQRK